VNVAQEGSVDLIEDSTDPIISGMSVFHHHLLKHEDKGMMAEILLDDSIHMLDFGHTFMEDGDCP